MLLDLLKIKNMEVEQNDPLWKIAQKRANFKTNLVIYVIINTFLWAIWYFTTGGYIWPIWPTLGWGVGLAFMYVGAYHMDKDDMTRREYEKLKNEQK